MTVFVSLRPETFNQSKVAGSLSAYQTRVFTIDPPRVDQVILKRLQFANKLLDEKGELPLFPNGISIHSQTLSNYLKMLLYAMENQKEIIEFIDNMSCGNIRSALEFLDLFMGSGHVDSKKILDAIENNGMYYLPLHEFLRAVIYGDYDYYDPKNSEILNVYDISSDDEKEHFLIPVILSFIQKSGKANTSEGYVDKTEVLRFTTKLGFHQKQIQHAIIKCLEKKLLATSTGLKGEDTFKFRITTKGAYMYKKLMFNFSYIDVMIVDTPIVNFNKKEYICNVQTIIERLDRASIFIEYLLSKWKKLNKDLSKTFDFQNCISQTIKSIYEIKEKVNKNIEENESDE